MDAAKPKAYVASALGFSELGRSAYYAALLPAIERAGYEILDPWRLTAPAVIERARAVSEGASRRRAFRKANAVIGGNNRRAIEMCDEVVAVLDGPDVDSGTAAEIGYAAGAGKRVIGYRNDFRLSGDNEGAAVNLQVEYFIRQSGGRIAPDLRALERALRAARRRRGRPG